MVEGVMSLESQIGARLSVGLPGCEVTEDVIAALRAISAQCLIVFERNFASPEQFRRLISHLEESLQRRMLILVDHEGGRVVRFQNAVTHFPNARLAGETQDADAIERQGTIEAGELKRLGVHMNLAPCVDVSVQGADSVISDRSYGANPERVSRLSAGRIHGLQSHGVAACAKHFPGIGAVRQDPHKILPTISLDWTVMEEVHLPPFQDAIVAGVSSIMSSHVCYPGLGDAAGLPATFSRALILGLLRDRLTFPGVILTDDLQMGAVRTFGSIGEAAIRSVEAGHDLLLICSDLGASEEAFSALRTAYESGRLNQDELEDSVERIQILRQRFLA